MVVQRILVPYMGVQFLPSQPFTGSLSLEVSGIFFGLLTIILNQN